MKLFLALFTCLLMNSCSQKEQESGSINFNGFPFGTTAEAIISTVGMEPDSRSESKLVFHNVHFDGVMVTELTYNLSGGKLQGGMVLSANPSKAKFDSLLNQYQDRYGPVKGSDPASYRWEQPNKDDLFLSQDDKYLTVIASQYKPNR